MILDIEFMEHTEDWFLECAMVLNRTTGCKVLKKKEYLTLLHIAVILNITPSQALSQVIQSETIHGFTYQNEVYVHPTKFISRYIKNLVATIDAGNVIIENEVHKLH